MYSIGHSFNVFMPGILARVAKSAGIADHQQAGLSPIGGSCVIQHWDLADDKFKSKATLESGNLDVLTIAPLFLPDEGIETSSIWHPRNVRKFECWFKSFGCRLTWTRISEKQHPQAPDREVFDLKKLQGEHDKYFHDVDELVKTLNGKYHGKPRVFLAPVGQAALTSAKRSPKGPPRAWQSKPTCSPTRSATPSRRLKCWSPIATTPRFIAQPDRPAGPPDAERRGRGPKTTVAS